MEAEQRARDAAERAAREEAERAARLEAERVASEEAERAARLEAERKAKEEAEARARRQAETRARLEAAERTRVEAERALLEKAERTMQRMAERARHDADQRTPQVAEPRLTQELDQRARQAERPEAAPVTATSDRLVPRVVARERSMVPAPHDLDDTTATDGPYRYLALARREGFQVSAQLERGTPERPETVWLLNEPESGLRLTIVTTDEEVREASLHYNIRTDDDALIRITPPEHRDVESRIIYVREPCIAELRSRCRRLRATGALAREWKVTPALHPGAPPAQYR